MRTGTVIGFFFFFFLNLRPGFSNQIWDLRTGGVLETIKYEHGVTALQFDSRKVICASGENGVKVRLIGQG